MLARKPTYILLQWINHFSNKSIAAQLKGIQG
jgi:hypothetical protein